MTAVGETRREFAVGRWPLLACAGAVTLALAVGCTNTAIETRGSRSDGVHRRPTPEGVTVEVLERSTITRPFKLIGVVQATATNRQGGRTDAAMLGALKGEARKLGADAITELVKNPDCAPAWWPFPLAAGEVHEVHWAALAIVWLD